MKINIIGTKNGAGLEQDFSILAGIFKAQGWHPAFVEYHQAQAPQRADVNIFLELFGRPEWCQMAPRNYLLPNQEWFLPHWEPHLQHLTAVLAKTRHAEKLFGKYIKTVYTGFTSRDPYQPEVEKRPIFAHFAGRSSTKGTYQAVKAWKKNPDLPTLHIYHSRAWKYELGKAIKSLRPVQNVQFHFGHMPSSEFRYVFNQARFHVCPSPAEGFGHYINEALACNNLVITTAGPPMDELVADGINGITVPHSAVMPHHWGKMFVVSPFELASAARLAMTFDENVLQGFGRAGRRSYEARDKGFRERIVKALKQ